MANIQAIRGTKDITPNEIHKWHSIEQILKKISENYGYREIRTPVFEKTEVFSRGVGAGTDIVNKEMYTFADRSGESLTLRPEQTAALVRAIIQNNLVAENPTARLYYIGAYYRYERPQKGRLREFHQYGAECISSPYPESDAETISLADSIIRELGIDEYSLKLNSLGNESSRKTYLEVLIEYLHKNINNLSEESQSRIGINPLRILDSKHTLDIEIVKNAPNILEYLDAESQQHFERVCKYLEAANIKYTITPTLVRGLDYYSHTVFEFQSNYLGSQDAFGGGGRYNKLFSELGAKDTPAVGFAMGIERILLILDVLQKQIDSSGNVQAVIIPTSNNYYEYALRIAAKLRNDFSISTIIDLQRRSLKSQMREAGKISAKYAIIIGDSEFESRSITIKYLNEDGRQIIINEDDLKQELF